MESSKVYVEVVARFDKDGVMMPMAFVWEDGKKYEIDKVKSKDRCASRKAGGTGIMYAHVAGKSVELPTNVDAELLAKVLSNPEMAALLTSLAKSMDTK